MPLIPKYIYVVCMSGGGYPPNPESDYSEEIREDAPMSFHHKREEANQAIKDIKIDDSKATTNFWGFPPYRFPTSAPIIVLEYFGDDWRICNTDGPREEYGPLEWTEELPEQVYLDSETLEEIEDSSVDVEDIQLSDLYFKLRRYSEGYDDLLSFVISREWKMRKERELVDEVEWSAPKYIDYMNEKYCKERWGLFLLRILAANV